MVAANPNPPWQGVDRSAHCCHCIPINKVHALTKGIFKTE